MGAATAWVAGTAIVPQAADLANNTQPYAQVVAKKQLFHSFHAITSLYTAMIASRISAADHAPRVSPDAVFKPQFSPSRWRDVLGENYIPVDNVDRDIILFSLYDAY
jgi:hypothetical protein